MKRLLAVLLVLWSWSCYGAIPHAGNYEWGTLSVPESYALPGGQKLQIYWEKLKSTTPGAEAIVLINGGPGMSHDSFHHATAGGYARDWFEALRTHFDVYYFDQRGTGKSQSMNFTNFSGRNYRCYGTPDISRDIEELRKNVIKKNQIAVLGESYGGMVALSYATMFPDAVSKLIIHDSAPANSYFTRMHLNLSNGLGALDEYFPGVEQDMNTCVAMFEAGEVSNAQNYPLTANDFLTLCLPYTYTYRGQATMAFMALQIVADGRSDILDAILAPARQLADRALYSSLPVTLLVIQTTEMLDSGAMNAVGDSSPWSKNWSMERLFQARIDFKKDYSLTWFSGFNLISKLGQIKAPSLVIVGDTDFICPPDYAETMADGIPDCRLLRVKNAAHGGFIEQNEFVVGKIRSFLLNLYPGEDERITLPDANQLRKPEEAVRIWLEGAIRLGLTGDFLRGASAQK